MKLDGLSKQTISRIDKAREIALEHNLEAEITDLSVVYSPEFPRSLWRKLGNYTEAYEFEKLEDLHLKRAFYRTAKTIFVFHDGDNLTLPEDVQSELGIEAGEDSASIDGKLLDKVQIGHVTYFCR